MCACACVNLFMNDCLYPAFKRLTKGLFVWKVWSLTLWMLLFRKLRAENLIKAPTTVPDMY